MYILGVWDGHDSGAALLEDNRIVFASNEERYTRRKLEVKFPYNSIKAALAFAGIKPSDINTIAFSTTEFAKTLSRVFPYQMERYYKLRRRKLSQKGVDGLMYKTRGLQYRIKYWENMIGKLPGCDLVSKAVVARHLRHIGFENFRLYVVDHHTAHAATAAFSSGFKNALVLTADGYGDGLSATISTFENGKLERHHAISANNSIGIIYEQVTNLVGMRELEDEGKVMAMADYSYPFKFEENKLKDFLKVEGINIKAKYSPVRQYSALEGIAWATPREQLAYFAQQLTEHALTELARNALERFGKERIAMAGGIFSNVKANMKIRRLDEVKEWFVFPHMGDGGMAMGSAMYVNYMLNGVSAYKFENAYFGDGFDDNYIENALRKEKEKGSIYFQGEKDVAAHAAELVHDDNYVFWFQGRMEYGPRALGNRSIIAKAGSETVKDKLNLYVKQREWYQPFAPSMLDEEAAVLLNDPKGLDKFMTMAYEVKETLAPKLKSVIHVDNTARPQMVGNENMKYKELIKQVKKHEGYGVVLNTSFNIHGMPIVRSPEDAIETMRKTKTRHMLIGNFYVENIEAKDV
ncbi:MAG: carbamoyltransferase C-terminal domain-containing protein [Candidatus Micrarchaeaceae archaeon]